MDITVAICTWNRAALLDQTLEGLRQLKIPPGISWELVVVNNNCSDNTDEIIEKHQTTLPLTKIFEPKQGLSNARNAAVDHAQGQYILWTDDDVLVDSQWITAYLDAFKRWPDAAVFGGKVLPWFEASPPDWLSENIDKLSSCFALRDFGDKEMVLPEKQDPFGANMAFKTQSLKKHLFNPNLGRSGTKLVSGEETEVICQLRRDGATVVWVSNSMVKHFLPKSRMTLAYVRKYKYWQGYWLKGAIKNSKRHIAGYPLWLLRQWLISELTFRWQRFIKPKNYEWLDNMNQASSMAGQLTATKEAIRKKRID
jgi:glycosyltransferase involved in cell wall biosynthesis